MDELFDRVTSGRIFKQIAVYARGRKDSIDCTNFENRSLSVFEDAKDCYLPRVDSTDANLPIDAAEPAIDANDLGLLPTDNSWIEHEKGNDESTARGITHIPAVDYVHRAGNLPLVAKYAEIFTFVGKDNEVETGVSLTEAMVWQLNAVLQSEQTTSGYISQINSLKSKLAKIEEDIADINSQLEDLPEGFEASSALVEAVLQDQLELEGLSQLREEVILEIQSFERAIESVNEDTRFAKNQLFSGWKETLAEGGLLEPFVEEPGSQIPTLQKVIPADVNAPPKPAPTPSEVEIYQLQDAREAAADDITKKTIQMQDAQEKFDSLQDLYHEEYNAYRDRMGDESNNTSKSEFDGMMFLESRKITADLINAEGKLEQACNHARKLGLTLDAYDQESCFVDFPEDGYRESLENDWITYIDRGRIEEWMDHDDETPGQADCDEWESKTVDISDSVSAIADTGKSRKRIDRWRAMCEMLSTEVEMNIE
ncbi:hypothetical protein N431DRAFT_453402 [Stipitochalara longipes BDJ]|nr:hypothetical protein N431DRAFT_453402 [Stipitochalara longipes BDJ]